MSKVKIQHYVPRFYLRNFSQQIGKEFYLHCFDKSSFRQFRVNITSIGCEKYFYEIENDPVKIEKILSRREAVFNIAYEKIISKKHLSNLSLKEKEAIATFATVQEIRTREMREMYKSIGKKIKNALSDRPLSKDLERQSKGVDTEQTARTLQLRLILETLLRKNDLVDILLRMKWCLYENNTGMPFWTSDHPLSRFNPIDLRPYGNLGLLCRGIEISFPLSPQLGLSFCDPDNYRFNPEKSVCKEDNVLFYNTIQLRSSTRHVFSIDNDFSIAKKWLNEHPDFRNIERKRID